MMNIVDFLTKEFIEENTIPSNFKYGSAIYNRSGVEYIVQEPHYIEAWAGGLDGTMQEGAGSRRRVTFTIREHQLRWNCTGNPKNHQIFCKHCVAVGLTIKGS